MATPLPPTIIFNNGQKFPLFGLGTWKSQPGLVTQVVKDAIDLGYRHFDCAAVFQNEVEIGKALTEKIQEGKVTRDELFVSSKLWNTFHSYDLVLPALKKTLAELNLQYIDLYLLQWPMGFLEGGQIFPKDKDDKLQFSDVDYVTTWKAMEECVNMGLAKSIGVSNFNSEQLKRILNICKIKPVTNQVECHPYMSQGKMIAFCKKFDIFLSAACPLGSPERPWSTPEEKKLLDDQRLVQIGEKYKKTPAQIVLRWSIQRNVITIPKSITKARVAENFNIFDFVLDEDDMQAINKFNEGARGIHLYWNREHKYYPFSIEY